MIALKEKLEQFRDLKISKAQLYNSVAPNSVKPVIDKPVEVCANHLIALLRNFQENVIDKLYVLDWVNTVWFSEWYEYCDMHCDSIASVINELEEIDEEGKELTPEKVEKYIYALENNIEI